MEADKNTHKCQSRPLLPSTATNTGQPVSSACQFSWVSCCWAIASATGKNRPCSFFSPPATVPAERVKPWSRHCCNRRWVGRQWSNFSSRISTQTEIPSLPLGIKRAGAGAVTMPGSTPQRQAALYLRRRITRR